MLTIARPLMSSERWLELDHLAGSCPVSCPPRCVTLPVPSLRTLGHVRGFVAGKKQRHSSCAVIGAELSRHELRKHADGCQRHVALGDHGHLAERRNLIELNRRMGDVPVQLGRARHQTISSRFGFVNCRTQNCRPTAHGYGLPTMARSTLAPVRRNRYRRQLHGRYGRVAVHKAVFEGAAN